MNASGKEQEKNSPERYTISSVEKTLDVMEKLAENQSLSLIELSDMMQHPKSSLYRIILTLEKRGYISRSEPDGKYCLGYKHLMITRNLLEKSQIRHAAYYEMQKLVQKYGDTVNLGVLSSNEVMYLEIIEGTNNLRMKDTVGSRVPVHATAIGKAIAAHMDRQDVEALLDEKPLIPMTARTITKRDNFFERLGYVRDRGYSFDDQEMFEGVRCIGAPVFDMYGNIAGAISMSGALHQFHDENMKGIAKDVVAVAASISRNLGYAEA